MVREVRPPLRKQQQQQKVLTAHNRSGLCIKATGTRDWRPGAANLEDGSARFSEYTDSAAGQRVLKRGEEEGRDD